MENRNTTLVLLGEMKMKTLELLESALKHLVSTNSSNLKDEGRLSINEIFVIESSSHFVKPTIWRENADIYYFQVVIRSTSITLMDKEYWYLENGEWVSHIDRPCNSFVRNQLVSVSKLQSEDAWHVAELIDINLDSFEWSDFINEKLDYYSKLQLWN